MELTPYQGELSLDGNAVPVSFRAGMNLSGELIIDIDPIPLSDRSKFIVTQWDRDPARFVHFGLTGLTDNNRHFETSDLFFTTLGSIFNRPIAPKAQCSAARITWKLKQPVERPLLRMKIKAFRCLNAHDVICPLGQVAMTGQHTVRSRSWQTLSHLIQRNGESKQSGFWSASVVSCHSPHRPFSETPSKSFTIATWRPSPATLNRGRRCLVTRSYIFTTLR